ncbi:GNAT family N-acetyltransferase [Rhizobium sp. Root1220]|uniref:GNAT family N-acetyltransferase n=1 Tax=Rhizobium sp. Root1220 TaxID=1736432 RepID=UPI0006F6B65C|nr:GNAT family N-acetyltransferase [Rhizobium sp. Root1220]KQV84211.1 acetyltransferase [Rhizobium sp. Root1220]
MSLASATYPGLTFRQDYFADHAAWTALVSLLQDTFGIDLDPLRRLGGADPTSMPFGWFTDDGLLAANLSAFAMPIVVNGRAVNAAAFQSGAVRPPWRGLGLYRDLTRKALDWCARRGFEAVVLYTDKPALYEPYDFRPMPMHSYSGKAPALALGASPARHLDVWRPDDLMLLHTALKSRVPVSNVLAVHESAAMFLINTQFDPGVRLSWLEREKAVVAWKATPERFALIDVVAAEVPSLSAIMGALGVETASVDVLFCPDKLGWTGEAASLEGATRFLIRSATTTVLDAPAMLSPMADF